MSDFTAMLAGAVSIFQTPVTLFGFTFSFWNVFFWSWIAGLVLWAIFKFFE